MISIWFFIGALLLVYGVLILGAGIHEAVTYPAPFEFHPMAPGKGELVGRFPEHPVVLENLHAGIWWGALLIVLGGFYTMRFRPRRES